MSGEGSVYSGLSARARMQLQREFTGFAPGGAAHGRLGPRLHCLRAAPLVALGGKTMNHLIARNPLFIAVLVFSALSGACARETAPSRTAAVEPPSRSTRAALGVTSRQAEAPMAAAPEARATMDPSALRDDAAPEGTTKADADLAWRARHALLGDSLLESCPAIDVSASRGKVTMRGTVPSALGHISAVADVVAVRGVFELDDQLETQAPEEAVTKATAASGSLR